MKKPVLLLLLGLLAGCATPPKTQTPIPSTAQEAGFESLLLWKSETASSNIVESIEKQIGFTQQGNFYKVDVPFNLFGCPAEYVGLLGVELLAGPNAVVKASPSGVAEEIRSRYGLKFKRNGGARMATLGKDLTLYIFPHPNLSGRSIIIGSYEGP